MASPSLTEPGPIARPYRPGLLRLERCELATAWPMARIRVRVRVRVRVRLGPAGASGVRAFLGKAPAGECEVYQCGV